LEISELKASVEAALFASDKPVTLAQVAASMDGAERKLLHQVLDELRADYESQRRGFRLVEIAEGWQLVSRPEHAGLIRRLNRLKSSSRLSRPSLETLAIIAYKQPLTKAEIENIRGVNSDGVMHNLLERRLVRTVGRKDVAGRPLLYGTTREFLQAFGLKDLGELPKLAELRDLLQQEPEADLWDIGADGKLVEKNPEDFIKSPSEELLEAKAETGAGEAQAADQEEDLEEEDEDGEEEDDEDEDDEDDDDED
jgi:segregation and condensation protein B